MDESLKEKLNKLPKDKKEKVEELLRYLEFKKNPNLGIFKLFNKNKQENDKFYKSLIESLDSLKSTLIKKDLTVEIPDNASILSKILEGINQQTEKLKKLEPQNNKEIVKALEKIYSSLDKIDNKNIKIDISPFQSLKDKIQELLRGKEKEGRIEELLSQLSSQLTEESKDFKVLISLISESQNKPSDLSEYLDERGRLKVAVDKVGGGGRTIDAALTHYQDILSRYSISNLDGSEPAYYGFEDDIGKWYILKEDLGAATYTKGTTDYSTNWINRSSLSYNTFNNTF